MTFDPEKIYQMVTQSGEDWVDKDAAATILEETKSIVLAELINQQPPSLGVAARENAAKADPAYRLHITNMVAARKEVNRARVKYKSAEMLAELRRSQEATNRSQMNLR